MEQVREHQFGFNCLPSKFKLIEYFGFGIFFHLDLAMNIAMGLDMDMVLCLDFF